MTQTETKVNGYSGRMTFTEDRRKQHELRAIFPAACESLKPFFDPGNQWAGHSTDHLALRELKEQFPALSPQDAFLVVALARRRLASS